MRVRLLEIANKETIHIEHVNFVKKEMETLAEMEKSCKV